MNPSFSLQYRTKEKRCEIFIQEGWLNCEHFVQRILPLARRFVLLTDSTLKDLYGSRLAHFLQESGLEVDLLYFPAGETSKCRKTKEQIEDEMQKRGIGKDAALIALGGGVVGDMAGFIASTYCRGIPWVFLPTTLLAMVDASIGGKNGVNTSFCKNAIGTIYHPLYVFMDLKSLCTLPEKEMRNGFAEMIKHGLIQDAAYFSFLEQNSQALLSLDSSVLLQAIQDSCRIKESVVILDSEEAGLRQILNFGHTIAHALEAAESYQISHGEAVAIGLLVESFLSWKMGYLDKSSFLRIENILHSYHFLQSEISYSPEFFASMTLDKKAEGGVPRFVLLEAIGRTKRFSGQYTLKIPLEIVKERLCDLHSHSRSHLQRC